MTLPEAISQRIKYLCRKQRITPNKLGKLAGLEPSTLTSIFYGKSKNPGIVTMTKICRGLGITIIDFFSHEVFDRENIEL